MKARQRFIKNLVAGAVLVGAIAIGTNVANAALFPRTQVASANQGAGLSKVTSTPSSNKIDTQNREAVRQRFLNDYVANDQHISPNYGADVSKCEPGQVNPAAAQSIQSVLNFFRGLSGLDQITIDTTGAAAKYAQSAALNMAANRRLEHQITSDSKCYSEAAQDGAEVSNLSDSQGQTPAEQILWYYMDWSGEGQSTMTKNGLNDLLGHRRLLMEPTLATSGYGNVDGYNAMTGLSVATQADYDLHDVRNTAASTPETVTWPSAGYFPSQLLTSKQNDDQDVERWHFSLLGGDLTKADISLTGPDGNNIAVQRVPFDDTYQQYHTIIFKFPKITDTPLNTYETRDYTVKISGVQGTGKSTYTYTVKLFDPMISNNNSAPKIQVLENPRVIQGGMPIPGRFSITGDGQMSYQWERSTDNGQTWSEVHDQLDEFYLSEVNGLPTTMQYAPSYGTCRMEGVLAPCKVKDRSQAESLSFRVKVTNRAGTTYSPIVKLDYYGFETETIQRSGNTLHVKFFHGDGDSIRSIGQITWVNSKNQVVGTGESLQVTPQLVGQQISVKAIGSLGTFHRIVNYTIKLPAVTG